MTELLEALLAQSGRAADVQGLHLLAQSKVATAAGTPDQEARNKLLDEAIAIQDRLVELTKAGKSDKEQLEHYRYTIDRAVTEGITKAKGYVERLQYFLERPGDRPAIVKLTQSGLGVLDRLIGRMEMTRDAWSGDDEMLVTGQIWRLEAMLDEARYRAAWMRFSQGMALSGPGTEARRRSLLQQAIAEVVKFAEAEDNASGVKYTSLLLSGMAARELGKWSAATAFLERAAVEEAGPVRLKALFELARCLIEQGQFAKANEFIESDFARIGRQTAGAVAAEMQGTLLRSHMLEAQAASVEASDPGQARQLREQSLRALLEFIDEHPQYRLAFLEVIGPKFENGDVEGSPPAIQAALGTWHYSKKSPAGFARAEELFEMVLRNSGAAEDARATALWYLGLICSAQERNLLAATRFTELAEKHPKDPRAKHAALNAVISLNAVVKAKNVEPRELGNDFLAQYAHALEVLVSGWAESDEKIRLYYYDLGMQYEELGRNREAIEAFKKVPAESELSVFSRYKVLNLSVQELLDRPGSNEAKRDAAGTLLSELGAYVRLARQYAAGAKPDRAEKVRTWAAKCRMLEAQLYKDVFNDASQAIGAARRAAQEWPNIPGINEITEEFIVRVSLEAGRTDEAIEVLQGLPGADKLVAETVRQIQVRIDRLETQTDPQSRQKLRDYREAYRVFAERLHESAKARNLTKEQMYPFDLALAGAYEFGTEEQAAEALELYLKLDQVRPNEATNIRGLARCYRRLGKYSQAMKQYDRLIDGLPECSNAWWRAQLERLQFFIELPTRTSGSLEDVISHISVLRRFKGSKLGGLWEQFAALENKAKRLLGKSSPTEGGGGL